MGWCMCHHLRVTHGGDDATARMAPPEALTGPGAPRPPWPGVMLPGPFLIPGLASPRQFSVQCTVETVTGVRVPVSITERSHDEKLPLSRPPNPHRQPEVGTPLTATAYRSSPGTGWSFISPTFGLAALRCLFEKARQRSAANPKVGLMKLQPGPGELRYAVAVRGVPTSG